MCNGVKDSALNDMAKCVEVLDELYTTRVRVPRKNPFRFFCHCLNMAIQNYELCDEGFYTYFKTWYDYGHIITEHQYWAFNDPIDLTEE